jgi:hypothetical protein
MTKEVTVPATTDAKPVVDATKEAPKPADKQTLAQAVEKTPETPAAGQPKEDKVVPEGQYIKLKDGFKELKKSNKEMVGIMSDLVKTVQDLKANGSAPQSDAELDAEVAKLSTKWKADPQFVRDMLTSSRGLSEKQLNKTLKDSTKKKEDDEDDDDDEPKTPPTKVTIDPARLATAVNDQLDAFLKDMPEYKGIVNAEVIKALVLADPNKNMNRTINDLVEEVYGNAVGGKKSIDTTKPAAGGSEAPDFNKPLSQETYREVMADKDQRGKYVDNLIEKAKKFL